MVSPVEKAVQALGSQSALARALNLSPQAVQQWVEAGRIPYDRVLAVEEVSGVSRQELLPDLYLAPLPSKSILQEEAA